MKIPWLHRFSVMLSLLVAWSLRAQVVNVTASLDAASIPAGGTTTLRVFAQVIPEQRTNANRIFSWHVDVLNTNGSVASANYAGMLKTASDREPSTSSTGTQDGTNRRGIYDTFLNLPGAGVSNRVELMAIPITGLNAGQTRFRVQAGTGPGLSSDFLVARNGGGPPMSGGDYLSAEAVLTVVGQASTRLTITVTNASGGNKGVTLRFLTVAGFNYTAQYQTNLMPGTNWQSLPGAPHNSGVAFELTPANRKFYRLAISPSN